MHRETKQRTAILKYLNNTKSHPTADIIYDVVKKIIPNISKGTIYRNLNVLKESGQVTRLNIKGTVSRYEIKQASHYHFRCEQCGRVFDIDEPVDKSIDERVAKSTGFKVIRHQLEFRGLCKDCQR
ncbi:MAG: transcriptional repressor [Dehalococcoidales bacterium]|nr:transcriptional repressor [Dehalococcoidales bacterium]